MKTKEEILQEKYISFGLHQDNNEDDVLRAMDEYAKQQALAFDVYRRENGYILEHGRNEYMKFGAAYINEPRFSPEDLYAQFIEHQNKNNP